VSQPPAVPPSLAELRGVGPRLAERLARLGIQRARDLLFLLPYRYEDRTRVVPMAALRHGMRAVVEGTVTRSQVKLGRRRMLLVHLVEQPGEEGGAGLVMRLFHFSSTQQASLPAGTRLRLFGEVRRGPTGLEMVHPEYRRLDAAELEPVEQHLTPIYPTTEGLSQLTLRQLVAQVLDRVGPDALPDLLPQEWLAPLGLARLDEALLQVHRPAPDVSLRALEEDRHPARQRLALEELLAHNLSLRQLRERSREHAAPVIAVPGRLADRLLARLPFTPTGAQRRVVAEALADLRVGHPMQRLLQGDVGSGKTLVAAWLALHAVEAGLQVAFMAPTELLAEQHLASLGEWLKPLGIELAWLSGRQKGKAREQTLTALASGRAAVAVGTHALFQDDVVFRDLGLVVVDEQHRFGVHQRLALREKGAKRANGTGDGRYPHQLIMTATPIPRTLAMSAYADLDLSVIDELPPGRKPVQTVVLPSTRREEVMRRIHAVCRREGRQVYWVCTLIEESDALQAQAAEDTAALLAKELPGLRVGLVHGRMKGADKEAAMAAFKRAETDLLVATTVIEVGVDVPNASLMVIENAERLGLAQLHQLRGRVGRGEAASVCLLMYQPPLSDDARKRLSIIRHNPSGFRVAEEDLKLRGPGELLGTRQTGDLQLRVADIVRDGPLIPRVQSLAERLLREHPENVQPLIDRWLGEGTRYAEV
jgi:ATP-dependent DNA helicase RecG